MNTEGLSATIRLATEEGFSGEELVSLIKLFSSAGVCVVLHQEVETILGGRYLFTVEELE